MTDSYALAVEARDVSIFDVGSSPVAKHVSPDSCRDGLREAGARRQLAERLRNDAMLDLADWITVARTHGLEVTEIARLAGVTRQTVYTIIGR